MAHGSIPRRLGTTVARADEPGPLAPRGTFLRCVGTALLGVAASGCAGDKPADSVERAPASEAAIQLTGVPFSTAVAIGQPGLLRLSGPVLWVADIAEGPGLHALNAQSGEVLRSFGPRGQGPGDFSGRPFGLEVAPGDSGAIWAFDQRLQRVTRFEAASVSTHDVRTLVLQGQPRVLRVAWVGASRIIGQSNSGLERFAIFGPDGSRLRTVPGQLAGPDSIPIDARANASNASSRMCTWPGRGFVVAYPYFGRVELFDTNATFVVRADVPLASEPVFAVQTSGAYRVAYDRRWYVGCAANREYVFALFSGRRADDLDAAEQSSASSIHVFDWAGRLRAVFTLDRSVFSLAVNDSGTMLFAGSLMDAGIYRYDLPAIAAGEDR